MKTKATFYHAGYPACVEAEHSVTDHLDADKVDLEIVHLGQDGSRLGDAEDAGVESVPALVLGELTLYINFGASIADLK